jgi:hypothetical protein
MGLRRRVPPLFAGLEPALALPDLPEQAAVGRDLAVHKAFVGRW